MYTFAPVQNCFTLSNTVLILGASSDVAVACGDLLASRKYDLILAGRHQQQLTIQASDLQIRYGIKAYPVFFDALETDAHEKFYNELAVKPDITICVFGLLGDQKLSERSWKECKKVIDTNYGGAVSILNVVANDYEAQGSGVIVGISSVAGERGRMSNYIYGSTKAALTAYLSGLRNRLASKNISVITVKPGLIRSRMTEGYNLPKGLTAQPRDVANAILKAIRKRKNVIYVLPVWRLIMLVIRNIPEPVFKKLKL